MQIYSDSNSMVRLEIDKSIALYRQSVNKGICDNFGGT